MTAKNKNDVECVIYDCDGVLFDSLDANRRLYNKIAAATGRGELSPAELQYCHTHTVYEAIRHLFPGDAGKEKQALEVLKNVDFREFIVFLKMEPNLIETLEGLKKRGIKRAICTNRTTSMKHVVEKFCLAPYFDMVVTALDVEHPKPHPSAVEKILQELGVEKERVFFLGDSEVDRETAVSAGVRFISYKNCEIGIEGNINDHLDLITLLSGDETHSQE